MFEFSQEWLFLVASCALESLPHHITVTCFYPKPSFPKPSFPNVHKLISLCLGCCNLVVQPMVRPVLPVFPSVVQSQRYFQSCTSGSTAPACTSTSNRYYRSLDAVLPLLLERKYRSQTPDSYRTGTTAPRSVTTACGTTHATTVVSNPSCGTSHVLCLLVSPFFCGLCIDPSRVSCVFVLWCVF